jgi:hypothetical protein
MRRRAVAVLLLVAVVAAGGWAFVISSRSSVVALVNGERIARRELAARVMEVTSDYVAHGLDVTADMLSEIERDVLNSMIEERLLHQAAIAAGITVAEADVDKYCQDMAAEYGGDAAFGSVLRDFGYTLESFRAEVRRGMMIERFQDKHIAQTVDPEALVVSEAEIRARYALYLEEYDDLPELGEIAHHIEQELRAEKLEALQVIESLLEALRSQGTIEILL